MLRRGEDILRFIASAGMLVRLSWKVTPVPLGPATASMPPLMLLLAGRMAEYLMPAGLPVTTRASLCSCGLLGGCWQCGSGDSR